MAGNVHSSAVEIIDWSEPPPAQNRRRLFPESLLAELRAKNEWALLRRLSPKSASSSRKAFELAITGERAYWDLTIVPLPDELVEGTWTHGLWVRCRVDIDALDAGDDR